MAAARDLDTFEQELLRQINRNKTPRTLPILVEFVVFHANKREVDHGLGNVAGMGVVLVSSTDGLIDFYAKVRGTVLNRRFEIAEGLEKCGLKPTEEPRCKCYVRWETSFLGDGRRYGGGPAMSRVTTDDEFRRVLAMMGARGWKDHLVWRFIV